MPPVLIQAGAVLAAASARMLWALLTDTALRRFIVMGLEKVAKRTKSKSDDELVQIVKEAWDVK